MSAPNWTALRSTRPAQGKIRVMVVDDSVVIRHLVMQALKEASDIDVVGAEGNGAAALARIPELRPDVITLDIEMPVMNGLDTLRQIRKLHPKIRTVMFSTLTTRGASSTFEALALGADDYVAKASNAGSLDQSLIRLREELVPKIRQFFATALPPAATATTRPGVGVSPAAVSPPSSRTTAFRILGIGVSTGGPQALAQLFPMLPATLRVPVMVVQHMPPMFTKLLAERLDAVSPLHVVEAADGMQVREGTAYIAPGDHHLRLRMRGGSVFTALDQGPHENSCRPAVDVLFRSLAEGFGKDVLSVMLTGMGADGLRGTRAIKSAGGCSLVQDQASSVVWGMPGAVAEAGLADGIFPLSCLGPEIARRAGG